MLLATISFISFIVLILPILQGTVVTELVAPSIQSKTKSEKMMTADSSKSTIGSAVHHDIFDKETHPFDNQVLAKENFTPCNDTDLLGKTIPFCGRSLVFTGPRHGSTWFVNNIENCSYSQQDGTFGTLHEHSELWIQGRNSKVANLSLYEAEQYIIHNGSLKLFPWPWSTRAQDSKSLVNHCAKHNVPLILLERDVRHAFRSMIVAITTERWNANKILEKEHPDPFEADRAVLLANKMINSGHRQWKNFESRMTQHAVSVAKFLASNNFPYDRVIYDSFVKSDSIFLPNANCKIRNCNFVNQK